MNKTVSQLVAHDPKVMKKKKKFITYIFIEEVLDTPFAYTQFNSMVDLFSRQACKVGQRLYFCGKKKTLVPRNKFGSQLHDKGEKTWVVTADPPS